MSAAYEPSLATILVVAAFSSGYLLYLLRKLHRALIDLYDFAILSMIALLPAAFVLVPSLASGIAETLGVAYPFVIMFSALLLVVFVALHRLTSRLHKIEERCRLLIQETSLLRLDATQKTPQDKA